jgi:hypothetical protein
MLSDDDETPPVITFALENGRRRPVLLPTPSPIVTPTPVLTPRPTLTLKKPPFGRPPGSLTITELVERVTSDVRRATLAELEHRQAELRAEIGAEIKAATSLGLAALVVNTLAIVTVLVALAFSHGLLTLGSALALAAIAAGAAAVLKLARRPPATPAQPAPR